MSWIETTVAEFCPFIYGKSLPKTKRIEGKIPVYGSNGCVGFHSESCVTGPGIIIGRKGSVGAVHLSTVPFWPIDTSFYIEKESLDELKFTYYLLKSLGLESMNSDSAVPGLNRENAHALSIKIPKAKNDRERIGRWISIYDKKIELNRQTNQTLENIAQAIFKSWFVDFEPTRAKIAAKQNGEDPERAAMAAISGLSTALDNKKAGGAITDLNQLPSEHDVHGSTNVVGAGSAGATQQSLKSTAALFPDTLTDSELGQIPEGWEVKSIGDVVKRLKPKNRYTKKQVEPFGSVPVYEQGAGILLGFHNDEAGFLASPGEPLFIFGDHTCVVHLSCENFDISQNVIPLAGNKYPTIWVYYSIQGKQEFQEYRRHWSEFIIKKVVAPLSDVAVAYAEFVTLLYRQKEQLVKECKNLEQVRDALLPKLLSGELEITEMEKAVVNG